MNLGERIKGLFPNGLLKEPFAELNDQAIAEAQLTANYLRMAGLDNWNTAANIVRKPPVDQDFLDSLTHAFQKPAVKNTQSKSGQMYSVVDSPVIAVGLKWKDNQYPIPSVAHAAGIFFLFFHYDPSSPSLEQYDACLNDYLHFVENNFNSDQSVRRVDNNNRLSQLIFSWNHFSLKDFTTYSRRITFYRHEPMNLPEPDWVGGTFISTNNSNTL